MMEHATMPTWTPTGIMASRIVVKKARLEAGLFYNGLPE
jgi:hypothetical protein